MRKKVMRKSLIPQRTPQSIEQWKNPGCLVYIEDYITQLYRDYNKLLRIPIKQPVWLMESKGPRVFWWLNSLNWEPPMIAAWGKFTSCNLNFPRCTCTILVPWWSLVVHWRMLDPRVSILYYILCVLNSESWFDESSLLTFQPEIWRFFPFDRCYYFHPTAPRCQRFEDEYYFKTGYHVSVELWVKPHRNDQSKAA